VRRCESSAQTATRNAYVCEDHPRGTLSRLVLAGEMAAENCEMTLSLRRLLPRLGILREALQHDMGGVKTGDARYWTRRQ
jgi:hypothetical protein